MGNKFRRIGCIVFIEAFIFVLILLGLVYAWRKGHWKGLSSST